MNKTRKTKTPNNRRTLSKSKIKQECDEMGSVKTKSYNDASWYAASPQLLTDAASLAFGNATGITIDVGDGYLGNPSNCASRAVAPGIMAIDIALVPGLSKDNSSAVNVAARQVYSFVRHANSGHSNYDSPDLMLYLLAMDEIYAFYNNLRRVYGTMMTYNIRNRYKPRALVEAMGFDFDDIQDNLANFRYYINQAAAKINTLCVPSTMTYMIRHSWMFSNIYADSDSPKAQMYVFRQDGYRYFDETSLPAKLQYVKLPDKLNFSQIQSALDTMLSKVIESEDMNIMSGDVLKAYGEGSLFRVVGVEEGYSIDAVFNPEVLMQIQNATILPELGAQLLNITYNVDTNTILFNPFFSSTAAGWSLNKLVNMHMDSPTPSDVMVATRLMVATERETPKESTPTEYKFYLKGLGSEVAMNARLYYLSPTGTLQYHNIQSVVMYQPESDVPTTLSALTVLTKFDYHPCIWLTYNNGEVGNTNFDNKDLAGFMYDLDNYTVIDGTTLGKMHDTAILSEFGIGK